LKKIQNDYQQAEQFVNFEYQNALSDLQHKKEILKAQNETVQLWETLYNQTLLQYKESSAGLLDLLETETELRQSKIILNTQLFDYQQAVLKLLQTQGKIRSLLQ